MHKTVRVKVNAWVDEDVAPLVLALNEFPNVWTLDSCQGENGKHAYVYFDCQDGPSGTIAVAATIADLLRGRPCRVYLLPSGDGRTAMGVLECQPNQVGIAADEILGWLKNED